MMFTRHLRSRIVSGEIDCTVRIWRSPRVKLGGRYPLEGGHVVVDKIREISIADITPQLARRSGFDGVIDLLKTARHGAGTHIYLIDLHYEDGAPA